MVFSLDRSVANVIVAEPSGPQRITRLPDGYTNLIFRLHAGKRTGDLTVSGPRTRAYFKTSTGIARLMVVRLKPGRAMSLLGVPASELTDRLVPLHQIWGRRGQDLCEQLLAATWAEGVTLISSALAARGLGEPACASLAERAVRILEAEDLPIQRVAQQLGVTARHLRRAFTRTVGIGPKDFARSVRLRRVVSQVSRSNDWARIAAETGYFDQAHLIADFRDLVGLTPAAFARGRKASAAPVEDILFASE